MRGRLWACGVAWVCVAMFGCGGGGGVGSTGNDAAPGAVDFAAFTSDATTSDRTGAISGQVLDSNGTPLAGASVTVQQPGSGRAAGGFTTTTDEEGWYHVGNVPPGRYAVVVHGDGIETTSFEVAVQASYVTRPEQVSVARAEDTAPTTGSVSGSVQSSEGARLAGARVVAHGQGTERSVISDASGEYRIGELPPGEYRLTCTRDGYEPATSEAISVEAGATRLYRFVLHPRGVAPGGIRGLVKNHAGAAVSGARVLAVSEGLERETHTNRDGVFEFGELPVGRYRLHCAADGYRPAVKEDVTVVSGQTTPVQLTLEPAEEARGRLTGVVRSTTGAALAGARVTADLGRTESGATTNGDGRYTIENLPAGTYRVTCRVSGYHDAVAEGVVVHTGQTTERNFTLEPDTAAGRVLGRVKDGGGHPVVDARVVVFGNGIEKAAMTDSVGHYEIGNVPAGTYTARCSKTGFDTVTTEHVEVRAGQATEANFTLTETVTTGRVVGRVQNGGGHAVAEARVVVFGNGIEKAAMADSAGRYEIGNVPAGTYTARCSKTGFDTVTTEHVEVRAGQATEVNFTLTETVTTGRVVGRVTNAEGHPLREARVVAYNDAHEQDAYTDEEGRYVIGELPPGVYNVKCIKAGYQHSLRTGVEVTAGHDREVNFSLQVAQ